MPILIFDAGTVTIVENKWREVFGQKKIFFCASPIDAPKFAAQSESVSKTRAFKFERLRKEREKLLPRHI